MNFNSKADAIAELESGQAGRRFEMTGLEAQAVIELLKQELRRPADQPANWEQPIAVITPPNSEPQIRSLNGEHLVRQAYEAANRLGAEIAVYGVSLGVFESAMRFYTPSNA